MDENSIPQTVLLIAKAMLENTAPIVEGDSTVVDGYWIETHTLGCRNSADEAEETWWDGLIQSTTDTT